MIPPMKQPSRKPTDAELAILRILWTRGPSTVRDVATEMGREEAYTTVLKLLQIMTDKQLVRRNESARTHIYEAAHSEAQMQQHLVTDLLDASLRRVGGHIVMRGYQRRKRPPRPREISKLDLDAGRSECAGGTSGWSSCTRGQGTDIGRRRAVCSASAQPHGANPSRAAR